MDDKWASSRAASLHTPHAESAWEIRELDESDSIVLEVSVTPIGYTGGGTQLREAGERWSRSCTAVGRSGLDSLQQNRNNPQRVSEKPRDSASAGFSGRSPLNTAAMGEKARIW